MGSAAQAPVHMSSVGRGQPHYYDDEEEASRMDEPWTVATRSVTPDKHKPTSPIAPISPGPHPRAH